jgi:hypothetical protein
MHLTFGMTIGQTTESGLPGLMIASPFYPDISQRKENERNPDVLNELLSTSS